MSCLTARLSLVGTILTVFAVAPAAAGAPGPPVPAPQSDLDAFMARVLERRDENWRKLHDYVLDETELFTISGISGIRLHGMARDFTWYVKDGYLVRSPVRSDGVAIPEAERQQYERRWIEQERKREARARERDEKKKKADARFTTPPPGPGSTPPASAPAVKDLLDERGEPRFVSEAYFLKFKFEPGHYYLAGRERFQDREVVRIEYYPTKLFADDEEGARAEAKADRQKERQQAPAKGAKGGKPARQYKGDVDEDEMERKMNKVAQVTLWIDQAEHQIVKYTFNNVDFGFLPGRWLVRVGEVTASMTMGRFFEGIWLPRRISMDAGIALASGPIDFSYDREFRDYRKAETSARIRTIGAPVK